MKAKLFFIFILIIATWLRLYRLGEVPLGLFGDEVDAGYNAYSFLKTGRDYNGNWLPIHFESMGDYRPFGFIISLVPSVALFGLSDFSVRLVPALWGILGVYSIYLLTNELFKNNSYKFGILAALLMTVAPWHIHYSRAAFEVTMMLSLLMLGVYGLIKVASSKDEGNSLWFFMVTFVFALASYTYNVAKLYAPLLLLITGYICRHQLRKLPRKRLLMWGGVYLMLITPLIIDSLWGQGQNRFQDLNLLNTPGMVEQINIYRGQLASWPEPIARIFHNKLLAAGSIFVRNYLRAFNPEFLFVTGEINNPRHSLPGTGLFFWWWAPLFFLGLIRVWHHREQPGMRVLLWWLLTAPLPAALTVGGGQHATRLFVMLPPLIIIMALGVSYFLNGTLLVVFTAGLIISLTFYLQNYYFHYPKINYRHWQYGLKPAILHTVLLQDQYKEIIITKNYVHLPMLYYLFYTQYDPRKLQQQFALARAGQALPPTDQIGKWYFATVTANDDYRPENALYVAVPEDRHVAWGIIGELKSPDPLDDKPLLLYLESPRN